MRFTLLRAFALACATGLAGLALPIAIAPARAAPPVEAFGDLPRAEFARLSPDGKHLAVIRPYDGREKVEIIDLSKPDSTPVVVGMEGGLAGDVLWKSDDRAIAIFHATLRGKWYKKYLSDFSRALSLTLSTRREMLLMWDAPRFMTTRNEGTITDMVEGDPDHVYMSQFDLWDHEYMLDLYLVDLASGSAALKLHGGANTIGFITDGHGGVLGSIEQDSNLTDHIRMGGKETFSYAVKGGAQFGLEGLMEGPEAKFAMQMPTPFGTEGLYAWDGKSQFGPALFENPTYDLSGVIGDERNGWIVGVTYTDDTLHAKYFDPALQRIQDSLELAYPGQSVSILSKDDAGASFVIATQGPRNPPVLSLFTRTDHQVKIIEEAYPDLKPSDLGEVKPYPYKAPDGLDIHAYLTLPPGRDPHNLPTVIFPHGGPEARDSMAFD